MLLFSFHLIVFSLFRSLVHCVCVCTCVDPLTHHTHAISNISFRSVCLWHEFLTMSKRGENHLNAYMESFYGGGKISTVFFFCCFIFFFIAYRFVMLCFWCCFSCIVAARHGARTKYEICKYIKKMSHVFERRENRFPLFVSRNCFIITISTCFRHFRWEIGL